MGLSDTVSAVSWSPDGAHIVSAGNDATVQVWEADTGNHIFTCRGHTDRVNSVSWSPDSKLIASASDDKTVRVWDATTGQQLYIYRGHSDWARALAWSPDGKRIASAGDDFTVQIWDATTWHSNFSAKIFIEVIPNGYVRSPGRPMASTSPQLAMTGRYMSGTSLQGNPP